MNLSITKLYILLSLFLIGCDNTDDVGVIESDVSLGEFIDDWTYRVFPKSTNNFEVAEFRLWLPENRNKIRGIIILCHSRNSNGLGLAHSNMWQEYAIHNDLGLLAVHFKGSDYTLASGGSGEALLNALEKITNKHNILEVNDLPFLMRGYSAGGSFSYNFAKFKPMRVVCFVNIRGALGIDTDNEIKKVPGLILVGELESNRAARVRNVILPEKRKLNHLLGIAIEPNTEHYDNLRNSDALVRTFFSAALIQRLSEGTNQLNSIEENKGWLGDNVNKNTYPFNAYPSVIYKASWLLDETFARHWKKYQVE